MKSSTPELMKFKKLQRRLNESRRGVIGLLEGLWIATAKNCPQGDIGRFEDEEIAIMCDWDGDPTELVDSLVECRWLDRCDTHRLVVHDWKDHCPTYIKGGLAKQNKDIATATSSEVQPIGTTLDDVSLDLIASSSEVPSTKPSLAKPSLAKSGQVKNEGASVDADLVEPELREWLVWWNSLRRNEPPLVPCGANEVEPSQAVLKAWKCVLRDAKLRKLATDRDAIEREIRASSFVREAGWLRPEKVLAGKNRDGEWIVKKLLEGGFRDGKKGIEIGPGQKFDPKAEGVGF